ncbi:MAG: SMI1/KNR4 family protein, partial [Chloroflexi bacterium]|nr:SMI1/KNR4 family protein [Chloroflexota bacterium]
MHTTIKLEALDRATTQEEIMDFERKFGLSLPKDYRDFLLAINVSRPAPN